MDTSSSSPAVKRAFTELERRIAVIPIEQLRDFCIVAYTDQSKSTLSSRLLEITDTTSSAAKQHILDTLKPRPAI
ncbi:GTP-binding protein lepa [Apiospora aurea]|uniref:GTP-binding protein lepa n=1 Tax=Apiospora aurea TaxID=335848 RepID=A0ABR1QT52_9PEZI